MKKIRSVINVILFFVIFMMIFKCVSSVFRTMDSGDIENINGFYMEEKNSIDVFFIGPSEFYTGYAPALAWEKYGLKFRNLSIGAVPCNMYKSMTKEILLKQSPKLIVVNAAGFNHGDWNIKNEVFQRKWIDNIELSENKIDTIKNDIPKNGGLNKMILDTAYFPLKKYHGSWKDPKAVGESIATRLYMKLSGGGYLKGYHAKADRTCGKERLADIGQPTKEAYFLTDDCKKYLDDYLSYCKNVGLENVLFVQPPHETEAITKTGIEQMESIINQYGYDFVDLSTDYEQIGIDDKTDFADYDHLNVYGTRKFTLYMSEYIVNKYGIHSKTSESEYTRWEKSAEKTKKVMETCEKCIDDNIRMEFPEIRAWYLYLGFANIK